MPFYDRICGACDWRAIDVLEPVHVAPVACPTCGATTARAWLTKASTVIGDEVDFVQHNGTREPIRFRSRSEFKRWLKVNEYHIRDSHVPEQGSDKSKFTRSWATYDPYTAENVRVLLERQFHAAPSKAEEPIEWHINWTSGELSREEAEKYAARNR